MDSLSVGVYEQVLDEELQALLDSHPDLKPVLRKIDDEEAPEVYAQFIGKVLGKALHVAKKNQRVDIINRLLELLSSTDGLDYVQRHAVLADDKNLLTQVGDSRSLPRPLPRLNRLSADRSFPTTVYVDAELRKVIEKSQSPFG